MDFGLGRKVRVGEGEKALIAAIKASSFAKASAGQEVGQERVQKAQKGTTNEREENLTQNRLRPIFPFTCVGQVAPLLGCAFN